MSAAVRALPAAARSVTPGSVRSGGPLRRRQAPSTSGDELRIAERIAGCTFLIREIGTTPKDIHRCERSRAEHPVEGLGRFANHQFMLNENGRRVA
jgi:hypothetical protein